VGVPAVEATVAVSVTAVPGDTVPVELAWVVVVVLPTTWKHSLVVVVDWEPAKEPVGV